MPEVKKKEEGFFGLPTYKLINIVIARRLKADEAIS